MQVDSTKKIAEIRESCQAAFARQKTRFLVCAGTGCVAGGSMAVYEELKRLVLEKGMDVDVELLFEGKESQAGVAVSGCHGFCQMGPLVRFEPKGIFYAKVTASDVPEIVEASLVKDSVVERLLYQDADGHRCLTEHEVPFYNRQQRIVLGQCGLINPEDIREYFAVDGYEALAQILDGYTREQVIDVVNSSGLRGRGGAGFPVGKKWLSCLKAPGSPKYVVCNGDEGDPGAFMDRSVLEGNPHAVIEGMIIAAFAIGASYGYIYVRAEYPLAVKRLNKAIEQARAWKILGNNIMGTDFCFDLEVFQGAGAFVCGESTALVRSIEGYRGMPKPLPRPRTTEVGLWDHPTLLNNVKTFGFIPDIIRHGAEWFNSTGTKSSPGTAVFALTGKIRNSGLIEVPMGIKLREIIYDIGGGVPDGKEFKAVQTGGPSGGCLPADMLDLEVDFDSLIKEGSMMGSGGMIVLDETSCMVDIARYFVEFTVEESCGQCAPCRDGMTQMWRILRDITTGNGRPEDLARLEEMGVAIIKGSICGLGQSAPNPVLSTLRFFRHEYEAHIHDKSCPALNCKELIAYWIDHEKCRACGLCRKACPTGAITGEKKVPHQIQQDLCSKCGICIDTCPVKFQAISKVTGPKKAELEEGVK